MRNSGLHTQSNGSGEWLTFMMAANSTRNEKGATPIPQSIAPDQNNRQLQLGFPSSFGFGPPCLLSCPDVCQASRTDLLPGFLNEFGCRRFPLYSHPLCDPGPNVGKSLCAHFPFLGLIGRCSFWRCHFDLRPSCGLSCSPSGPTGCIDLAPLGCFNRLGRTGYIAAQKLTELFLQRLDLLLDVGCLTELLR